MSAHSPSDSEKTDVKLEGLAEQVKLSLGKAYPPGSFEVRRVETVAEDSAGGPAADQGMSLDRAVREMPAKK